MRLGSMTAAIALMAGIVALTAGTSRAAASTVCTSRFPGTLRVEKVRCPATRRIVARYANVAQTRGPRIVVDGFHCNSGTAQTEGEVTIVCRRGSREVTYSGGF